MTHPLDEDYARYIVLDTEESMELLGTGSFLGHIGCVIDKKPQVVPVNYLLEGSRIIIATRRGSMVEKIDGNDVAFEVDDHHPLTQSGWSIMVDGTIHRIHDKDDLDWLARSPLHGWAWSSPDSWMEIRVGEISGRRIPGNP